MLIKGARQVGKTFIIKEFGNLYYDYLVEINFLNFPKYKDAFNGDLDVDTIIRKLTLINPNFIFEKGKTLLFLDEIQECGNARTALKFIALDNRFDCIASGSMLGVSYKQLTSIPVGYEKQIEMHSLDFEEFLWALGYTNDHINQLRQYFISKEKVPEIINDSWLEKIRLYAIIGGMPSVLNKYLQTNNFGIVHEEQTKIINSYLDDIAKYASTTDKPKARACYLSIPAQLAKENNKFQYANVEKEGRAKKFENSLQWLKDAGLIKFCENVSTPIFPLTAYIKSNYFKIYLTDIGILNAMYGFDMKAQIYNNTLKGYAKGGIYENLIADILLKKNIPLIYYKPDEDQQEIEFLLTISGNIIPMEVKAGNTSTYSLNNFIKQFNPPYVLKLINGNLGMVDKKLTLPLYMVLFL